MPYRLSVLAEQDLEEIWIYVAEDASPTTADRLNDVIVVRYALLVEEPAFDPHDPSPEWACGRSSSTPATQPRPGLSESCGTDRETP